MKNVLVLGGTGFVGAHVCEKLVRAGWQVTVPTRRALNAQRIQHLPGLTVLEADVHDPAALARLVAGQDAVVNLVAILHGSAADFDRVHAELPRKIAQASAAAGVQQIVQVSALGVNADQPDAAPSLYLRSKGRGEFVLRNNRNGVGLTIIRPSVIFGAEDQFINVFARLVGKLPFIPLAGAKARFQPVWVQDVAAAVVKALTLPQTLAPRVFEACGPQEFTLAELVRASGVWAGTASECGCSVLPLPEGLGRLQALAMEFAPGKTVMSRGNLDSMRVPNVATPGVPGLDALGIQVSAIEPIARDYLNRGSVKAGLLGVRDRYRS